MNTPAYRPTRFLLTGLPQTVVLVSVFLLTNIGCGSGNGTTTATTVPQPTQPTPTPTPTPTPPAPVVPPVPAGWTNVDRPYFNFSYPSGWQLSESTSAPTPYVLVTEPGAQHFFFVQFDLGVINQPDILSQCAGAYKYMTDFYNVNVLPLEKNVGQYPNTTTKYEPNYGFLGGKAMFIHVVSTPQSSGPNFNLWLNAIPRADGMYLVGYRDPGDSYDVWVAARKKLTDTLIFNKSKALPSTAYCNA